MRYGFASSDGGRDGSAWVTMADIPLRSSQKALL